MKISVVTICYNSKLFIEKTILSVINQSYEDLEYIVVDGGSTDGTLDVIHKYSNRITKWISEKDEGIYNAMNKALDIITGDWVIFMNSGDCFYRYDVLSNIDFLKYSEASCCGVIYGNGISLYRKKRLLRSGTLPFFKNNKIFKNMGFCHQDVFIKSSLAKSMRFRENFKLCADYDMLWRLYKKGYRIVHIDLLISITDLTDSISARNIIQQVHEEAVICQCQTNTIYFRFLLLGNIIDGYSNLNPARKARRNIFLTDEQWENERKALVNRLSVWLKLLRENDTAEQMRDKAKETAENAENLLNHNLKNALARTRELESAYRTIAFFYKNTESDKVKNVTIVNATMEQLQDLDNTIFADHISNELKQNFDRLDLRRNYSLLVVPGYIGSNAILDKWSKMAYENKVFLVTDFQDLETPDDVVDIFFNANHTSGDVFKSNTIMTCNWLLGRQREESVGEEENLYIPPSSSLAGKIYNTLMSQVVAGKKFGGLNEVESVRFDLRKSEISELERMGLVPMVNEYSKVMAFSAKTLFNGDNLGLQTYSVVRVFDYITKVLIDFLNRRAFENWTTRTEADLRGQVVKFLDSVMGPNKLIERFKVMKIEQDPNQKDRVLLDIHITPYFPAKSFVIQLAGHKGDNPEDAIWESEYHQE